MKLSRRNNLYLMASLGLLLVVGFALTSLASFFVTRSSLREQLVLSNLPLTSDNIYSEIQRDLMRPIFISSMMASDTFLRDWVVAGETDPAQMIKYLSEIKDRFKTFTSFFVSEQTRVYYQAKGVLKTVSPDEERDRWYFRVRAMASDYEINVDPDMANQGAMTIFINYKVFDYGGRFIGAAGVGLTVHAVKQLIAEYERRYLRQVYFVNPSGEVVLHGPAFNRSAQSLRKMEGLGALADLLLESESGNYRFKRKGEVVHLNARYIPEFDWFLLVEQEEGTMLAPAQRALAINLVVCAIITGIVLWLTWLALSSYQRRVEGLAFTDKLTGLHNRHAYALLSEHLFKAARRAAAPLAMILFDLNHFKRINDTFGHPAGDAALQQLAARVKEKIRPSDLLCRWGGDEFLILMTHCDEAAARKRGESIRDVVSGEPFLWQGKAIPVTISVGVAAARAEEGHEELLKKADQDLYRNKANGSTAVPAPNSA